MISLIVLLVHFSRASSCLIDEPEELEIKLKRTQKGYATTHGSVSKKLVEKIVSLSLKKPVKHWQFPLRNREWFRKNSAEALREYIKRYHGCEYSKDQKSLFLRKFESYAGARLSEVSFLPFAADCYYDLRNLKVVIPKESDGNITIETLNPNPIFVPLRITYKGEPIITMDDELASLIFSLFPAKEFEEVDVDYARRYVITEDMFSGPFSTKWTTLEIAARFPKAVSKLAISESLNVTTV